MPLKNRCPEVLGCQGQLGQLWRRKIVNCALGGEYEDKERETGCWLYVAFRLNTFTHTKSKMFSLKSCWQKFQTTLSAASSTTTCWRPASLHFHYRRPKCGLTYSLLSRNGQTCVLNTFELTVLLSSVKLINVH